MANYIRFFHGRKDPNEQLEDWGSEGPIVGPVNIGWTYGKLRLFTLDGVGMEFIPMHDDLLHVGDHYYGDAEIFDAPGDADYDDGEKILSFEDFVKLIKR